MVRDLHVPRFVDASSSHPRAVRLLNAIGRLVPRFGRYSADAWWAAARKGDLADCDPTPEAREALEALVDSIESDVRLNLVGRFSVKSDTVRMARTHLRVHRALREAPEIAGTSLPPPLFIIGWPRTGTTLLHQLLSQDPTSRTIPYWESFDPVPPLRGPDRRVERLAGMLRQLEQIAPNYQAIHPMEPELAPGQQLAERLEGAEPAGEGHEGVRQLGHLALALVHRVHHAQLGELAMGHLSVHERVGDHTDHASSRLESRGGDAAHHAHTGSAVDEVDALLGQDAPEPLRGLQVADVLSRRGAAEHADPPHPQISGELTCRPSPAP